MTALADPLAAAPLAMASLIGLVVGMVLGFAARIGDFCTLGTLETAILGRNYRRLHIWALALGTAICATFLADAAGWMAVADTLHHRVIWQPMASIIGGLIFGWGMAMAGNCGFGALTRAAGGDLRSLVVVVVLGIAAFSALSGPLARARVAVFPQDFHDAPGGIAHDLAALSGLPDLAVALIIGVGLIVLGLRHPGLRASPHSLIAAPVVGLSVVGGFVALTALADTSLDAVEVEGPSYTSSVGRAILFVMTSSGTGSTFGVGLVFGTLAGAFAAALLRGGWRLEACDDPRELGRQMGGAVLMGWGGVIAIGCTIGQGLTATATLAWSGPVTLAAIAAGAWAGLMVLVGGED